jgi:hypothetical protein
VSEKTQATGKGNFFAVDRRTWAAVCAEGINAAVSYLVLARFSARDNEKTTASVHAVESYTSISRRRSKDAITALCDRGFVRLLNAGTRPLYQLVPFAELPGRAPAPMTPEQRGVYEKIRAGDQSLPRPLVKARNALIRAGWVEQLTGGGFAIRVEHDALTTPSWIWLPNTIVDSAAGEPPPCELLRQTQDPMTLRLFVDLYYEQHLTEHGGVARNVIWQTWEREKVGERGEHVVWGFQRPSGWVNWENAVTPPHKREPTPEEKAAGKNAAVDFFERLSRIEMLGLLQWVPHIFESAGPEAEAIHPYYPAGESMERDLAQACQNAAEALLREDQATNAHEQGLRLAPIKRHVGNVQMVSVARLRYRPKTAPTSAWWAELNATCSAYQRAYDTLAGKADGLLSPAVTPPSARIA